MSHVSWWCWDIGALRLEGAASNRNRAGAHVIMFANQMHAALLAAGEIYKRPQGMHMGSSFAVHSMLGVLSLHRCSERGKYM